MKMKMKMKLGLSVGIGMAYRSLVGFGGCFNCGIPGAFFRPGFARFCFAHAGFGGGFRGGGSR